MRSSKRETERSRQRIVEGASRLLRGRGLDGTGVAEVMREAGMTQGGFYRHFANKDALVAEALEEAFTQMLTRVASLPGNEEAGSGAAWSAAMRAAYLSDQHVGDSGRGCPAAAVGTEVARADLPLRERFGQGVLRMVDALAERLPGDADQRRQAGLREFAMLAGAVILARASDPVTARAVLEAARAAPQPGEDAPLDGASA